MRSHLKVAVQRLEQKTPTGTQPMHSAWVYVAIWAIGMVLVAFGFRFPAFSVPLAIAGGVCLAGACAGLVWWILLGRYWRKRDVLFEAEPTWIRDLDCIHLEIEGHNERPPGYRCTFFQADLRAERLCLLCPCYLMRGEPRETPTSVLAGKRVST